MRKMMEAKICDTVFSHHGEIIGGFLRDEYAGIHIKEKMHVLFYAGNQTEQSKDSFMSAVHDTTTFIEELAKSWKITYKEWNVEYGIHQTYLIDVINQYCIHAEPIVITIAITHLTVNSNTNINKKDVDQRINMHREYGCGIPKHFDFDTLVRSKYNGETITRSKNYTLDVNSIISNCRNRKFIVLDQSGQPSIYHENSRQCIRKDCYDGSIAYERMVQLQDHGWKCLNQSCKYPECIFHLA